jgi:hypothetical protein
VRGSTPNGSDPLRVRPVPHPDTAIDAPTLPMA